MEEIDEYPETITPAPTSSSREIEAKDIVTTSLVGSEANNKFVDSLELPPLIVLCGYAASGKSTLSSALVRAYPDKFIRVNKDEMRKKGEFEGALHDAFLLASSSTKKAQRCSVVVDQCCLTKESRRSLIEQNHKGRAWCIILGTSIEECRYRIQRREGHPTIPSGKFGLKVLESMEKNYISPTVQEGFEKIIELRSEDDMNHFLLEYLKVPLHCIHIPTSSACTSEPVLVKFPRTPHIANLGAATRDDKLISNSDLGDILKAQMNPNQQLVIEEKIDGANMGLFIDATENKIMAQNRSHFVTSKYHAQFALLDKWIHKHTEDLWEVLEPGRHILYGEWCYATHSVEYTHLPDWFIAFDLFDKLTGEFVSRDILEEKLRGTSIKISPLIIVDHRAISNVEELKALVKGPSVFRRDGGSREGVVVRVCQEGKLLSRAKLVRSDFIAGNDRWNKSAQLTINQLEPCML